MTSLASSVTVRPSPYLVEANDVSIKFGNIVALDHVNFHVGRNEIVGLLGDNGAGKSTLIKALVGYHGISSGQILFEGKETRWADLLCHRRLRHPYSGAEQGFGAGSHSRKRNSRRNEQHLPLVSPFCRDLHRDLGPHEVRQPGVRGGR